MRDRVTIWRAGILALAFVLTAAGAWAGADASLAELKDRGVVGERTDGFLGLVDPQPSADVARLVEQLNAQRAEEYAAIAKKNGTTPVAVGALAGIKLIERAEPGHYVMDAAGRWRRKATLD